MASIPVTTRGNALWRGNERFLVKGISYIPKRQGARPYDNEANLDPLHDDRLEHLERDIRVFHELGLNTISIFAVDSFQNHDRALKLLEDAGIYVLVNIFGRIAPPDDSETNPLASYTSKVVVEDLSIVDNLSSYPNVLGFVVNGDRLTTPGATRTAPAVRAAVRDTKECLAKRGRRELPVGVSISDAAMMRFPSMQYFAAGSHAERADFIAMDCFSWAYKSSFQISGWSNMVGAFGSLPIPVFFAAFGANVGRQRIWQEIECLFSPDMTGVFSGGCMYTYFEPGSGYGIVDIGPGRQVEKKPEFKALKKHFSVVNKRSDAQLFGASIKDYEGWIGEFPPIQPNQWLAVEGSPSFPGDWDDVLQKLARREELRAVESGERMSHLQIK